MMFLMRLYFWKQPNKNRERPQLVRCHVHSRFFYFVKSLNLPALVRNDIVFLNVTVYESLIAFFHYFVMTNVFSCDSF